MKLQGSALRLTIFIGEDDQWHHRPLYHEIVHRAHEAGLAGASVMRGIEGYGASSRIHTSRILSLSEDLPLRSSSSTPATRSAPSCHSSTSSSPRAWCASTRSR